MIRDKWPVWEPSTTRIGATLSEVLVSLLIMSIGVVSLMVLFPISALRTAQATNLTNATILRYNAEAIIETQPQMYLIGQEWEAGKSYTSGQLVTPTALAGLKLPAMILKFTDTIPTGGSTGTSGLSEPNWNVNDGQTTSDGNITWTTFRLQNYVVDPLGEVLVPSNFRDIAGNHFFGNDPTAATVPQSLVRAFRGIPRAYELEADLAATLPDSFVTQVESKQVAYTPGATTCTVADVAQGMDAYVAINAVHQNLPYRVVLFDESGKVSHIRPIYQISGGPPTWTIDWTTPAIGSPPIDPPDPVFGPLPANFVPHRARFESRDRRYTWLLAVRRGAGGVANMDVVVFYKRTFSGKDEQLYPATFTSTTDFGRDQKPGNSGDDDGNGIADFSGGVADPQEIGYPGSDDTQRNWVIVQYDATGEKPFVKKGGFIADANNLRWYRIVDIIEGDLANGYTPAAVLAKARIQAAEVNPNSLPATTSFTAPYIPDNVAFGSNTKAIFLRLESPITQSGPPPTSGGVATNGGTPAGRAIIMRGVIDVFPIRSHLAWEN